MSTELYYFTGTGNGLHVAKSIKKSLEKVNQDAKLIAINTLDLSKEINTNAKRVGLIYPTYAMSSPAIVKEFARKLRVSSDSYTFLYAHCGGGGTGGAITSVVDILYKNDIRLSNTFEAVFPSNSALFTYTDEKLNTVISKADLSIKKNLSLIVDMEIREIAPTSSLMKIPSKLGGKVAGLMEGMLQFKNINSNDDCVGCSLCQKVCPMNNIEMKEKRPEFSNNCEMCFSCINNCPKKALKYKTMKTQKMMSYRHPEVEIKELMYR